MTMNSMSKIPQWSNIFKLFLFSILVGSGVIIGCETTRIVTKHEVVKTKKKLEKPAATPIESLPLADHPPVDLKNTSPNISDTELKDYCRKSLSVLPGTSLKESELSAICSKVEVHENCYSQEKRPIFHYEKPGRDPKKAKRILTLSLIHGDEGPSGTVSRSWMNRLENIDSRNTWRVIPVANPDGFKMKTRMNINGVDINRNFPSEDWEESALNHWRVKKKSDPRKFPGNSPASELETQCLIDHIKDFNPDFIISVHTPYGVLDFDGPRMNFPAFKPLPWISLGNYPGSLGRYMWVNNEVPVLTIELKGDRGINKLEMFDKLQDISGTVAIQATKIIDSNSDKARKNANSRDK